MGKVYTPTYRFELYDRRGKHILDWDGRPSLQRLEKRINSYIASLQPGGVNERISRALGYIPVPCRAVIVHQRTGFVVAEWTAPAFMEI